MEILEPTDEQSAPEATPEKPKRNSHAARTKRRNAIRDLVSGVSKGAEKGWLLAQFATMYYDKGLKAQDRLRALEAIARISGHHGKETPESERDAIQALMQDLDKGL